MKKIIKYLLFICLLFTGCTSGDYYNKIFKKNDIILEYSVIEDLDFEHKAYDIFLIENTEVFKENILSEYNLGTYNDLFFKEYFIMNTREWAYVRRAQKIDLQQPAKIT